MNKKTKWGLIIFICAGLAGLGFYTFREKGVNEDLQQAAPTTKGEKNNKPLNVNALVIKEQALTDGINTTGTLVPDEEVDLSFETSGKITEINFTEGTAVKKGQLLAKVNDRPLLAQLKKLQAQLKLAEDRVFRQNALLVKDAVSKEAYEQVKTDLATLNADIDLVKANISLTELRAPFDGIIGLRQVSEGSYASPTTIVAKLTKITPLKVEFNIPERYASQVHKGTRLTFSVTVGGKLSDFNASVYATESKVEQVTRTLAVRALYPNTGNVLLPGRYASVNIKLHDIPNAIAIPTESIIPEMGKDKVFLYKSGKSIPTEVTIGLRTDSQVQILKGLQVGDTIITSGTLQLRTGLNVTLDNID